MSFKEDLNNMMDSEVFKLTLAGKIEGFRLKIYDYGSKEFNYYDFATSTVEGDIACKQYLQSNKDKLRGIPLVDNGTQLITKEEAEGKIVVKESKSVEELVRLLKLVFEVEKVKKEESGV